MQQGGRLPLVEFVANFRWVLLYATQRLQPYVDHHYPGLLRDAEALSQSLRCALSETVEPLGGPEAALRALRAKEPHEDERRIQELMRLACDGYVYLLVAEGLLGAAPTTLHPFLQRALAGVATAANDPRWAAEEGGNPQSFVLLLRWLVHEGVLTEADVTSMDLRPAPSPPSAWGEGGSSESRSRSRSSPLDMAAYCRLARQLACPAASGVRFHLWGHLLLSQHLLLQEACQLLTVDKVQQHVLRLQQACGIADPVKVKATEAGKDDSEMRSPSFSDTEGTIEDALLDWLRTCVEAELFFQSRRRHEKIQSPYIRLLLLCKAELCRAADVYEALQSGLAFAVVLHFYLPREVEDPYAAVSWASSSAGLWAHVLGVAADQLEICAPFSPSEAFEYADSALSLHMYLFAQQLLSNLMAITERDAAAFEKGEAPRSAGGGLLRCRATVSAAPSPRPPGAPLVALTTRSRGAVRSRSRSGPLRPRHKPQLPEATLESIASRVRSQEEAAQAPSLANAQVQAEQSSPSGRPEQEKLRGSATMTVTPLRPMARRPGSGTRRSNTESGASGSGVPSLAATSTQTPPASASDKQTPRGPPPFTEPTQTQTQTTVAPPHSPAEPAARHHQSLEVATPPFGTVSFHTRRSGGATSVASVTPTPTNRSVSIPSSSAPPHDQKPAHCPLKREDRELVVVSARRKLPPPPPPGEAVPPVAGPGVMRAEATRCSRQATPSSARPSLAPPAADAPPHSPTVRTPPPPQLQQQQQPSTVSPPANAAAHTALVSTPPPTPRRSSSSREVPRCPPALPLPLAAPPAPFLTSIAVTAPTSSAHEPRATWQKGGPHHGSSAGAAVGVLLAQRPAEDTDHMDPGEPSPPVFASYCSTGEGERAPGHRDQDQVPSPDNGVVPNRQASYATPPACEPPNTREGQKRRAEYYTQTTVSMTSVPSSTAEEETSSLPRWSEGLSGAAAAEDQQDLLLLPRCPHKEEKEEANEAKIFTPEDHRPAIAAAQTTTDAVTWSCAPPPPQWTVRGATAYESTALSRTTLGQSSMHTPYVILGRRDAEGGSSTTPHRPRTSEGGSSTTGDALDPPLDGNGKESARDPELHFRPTPTTAVATRTGPGAAPQGSTAPDVPQPDASSWAFTSSSLYVSCATNASVPGWAMLPAGGGRSRWEAAAASDDVAESEAPSELTGQQATTEEPITAPPPAAPATPTMQTPPRAPAALTTAAAGAAVTAIEVLSAPLSGTERELRALVEAQQRCLMELQRQMNALQTHRSPSISGSQSDPPPTPTLPQVSIPPPLPLYDGQEEVPNEPTGVSSALNDTPPSFLRPQTKARSARTHHGTEKKKSKRKKIEAEIEEEVRPRHRHVKPPPKQYTASVVDRLCADVPCGDAAGSSIASGWANAAKSCSTLGRSLDVASSNPLGPVSNAVPLEGSATRHPHQRRRRRARGQTNTTPRITAALISTVLNGVRVRSEGYPAADGAVKEEDDDETLVHQTLERIHGPYDSTARCHGRTGSWAESVDVLAASDVTLDRDSHYYGSTELPRTSALRR